jgi:hypothetical protein
VAFSRDRPKRPNGDIITRGLRLISPHIVLVVVLQLVLEIKAEHDDEDETDDDSRSEKKILVSTHIPG